MNEVAYHVPEEPYYRAMLGEPDEVHIEELPSCCLRIANTTNLDFECPDCGAMWEPIDRPKRGAR
jgi:predicted RNA-binding Zn-ribbon protein involved in translation (DUF1610 family)